MTIEVGYCTNVHAGPNLKTMRGSLAEHARAVKQLVCPDSPLPVGLWISARCAKELLQGGQLEPFRQWLTSEGLLPYTLNGFPFGDFHQNVVKYDVYHPTWCEPARAEYTLDLIEILHRLLPDHASGSISTLPLQWGKPAAREDQLQACAANLGRVAERLAQLEAESGRRVCICLEPEPGCVLSTSDDLVNFYQQHLLAVDDEHRLRRYIQVCHDVCHGVVMFESQHEVLQRYAAAGISVGKVQISSAVVVPWAKIAEGQRPAALQQLKGFAEDRYLHQTVSRDGKGRLSFHDDLPALLQQVGDPRSLQGEWRIHFHIPVYLDRFGWLEASRWAILQCIQAMQTHHPDTKHFEVETYAWSVLPAKLQQRSLSEGIADEIAWFRQQLET